jgi:nicotinate-nucleotide--dimethylbenzimidazole phosphoribosyltransferase
MKTATLIEDLICSITAPPDSYLAEARAHLDMLTKPLGSLGRLEDLAAQWFVIRQGRVTGPVSKAVYVFAADHGITAEGVSAYPAEVTRQMVLNFLSGGAAINVLACLAIQRLRTARCAGAAGICCANRR